MGLFGGNFAKPGPGVDKDVPKKKGIFLFIEIFLRKFWNIIHANVLYFTASILFLLLLYIIAPVSSSSIDKLAQQMYTEGADMAAITANLQVTFRTAFAVMLFSLWGCAPMATGYAYIMRCYTREQHAWVWSDFVEKVKSNFKQSIVVFIADIVVLFLAINALAFYYMSYISTQQTIWLVCASVIGIMFIIYTMMHFYIYQLMVTFECTNKQLFKNALLLAVAKLPMNIVLALIVLALNFVIYNFLIPAVALAISFFLWTGLVRFPIEFYAARVLEKTFINNANSKVDSREAER